MARRRRRGSTSSLEATNTRPTVHYRQETSVLKTLPVGEPEDQWPIFELTEAVVLNQNGEMANALDVLYKGPFIVRGNMQIDDPKQKALLLMKVRRFSPIEVRKCIRYSIGEAKPGQASEDGSATSQNGDQDDASGALHLPILWLGGRCAWYEIKPSEEYTPTYRLICEAIKLYYAIEDHYTSQPAKGSKRNNRSHDPSEKFHEIFFKHTLKVGSGMTVEEITQTCRDLAPFFINQFLQSDAVDWHTTDFYRWIVKGNEDLLKEATDRIRNPQKANPPTEIELPNRVRHLSVASKDRFPSTSQEPSARSIRSRSSAGPVDSVPQGQKSSLAERPNPRNRSSKSRPIVPTDHQAKPKSASPKPVSAQARGPNTADHLAPEETSPSDVFEHLVEALERAYDELNGSKKGRRAVTRISVLNKLYFPYRFPGYKDGTRGSHVKPVEEVCHYNARALVKRLDHARWEGTGFYEMLQEMAQVDFTPVAMKPEDFPFDLIPRKKMQRQVASQGPPVPIVNTVSGGPSHQEDDDDVSMDEFHTPGRGKGVKTPGRLGKSVLRPTLASQKRSRPDSDDESDDGTRDAKRSQHEDSDDMMDEADTSGVSQGFDDDPIKIVIRADRLPSTTPRGPNGAWVCDHEDCDYIVRGGDAADCEERIRQHFEEHEQEEERVHLAVSESRGHLPINHLLAKIKQAGEAAELAEELSIDGVALSKPIKRKVIV